MITVIFLGFIGMFAVAGFFISMEAKQATGGLTLPTSSRGDRPAKRATPDND